MVMRRPTRSCVALLAATIAFGVVFALAPPSAAANADPAPPLPFRLHAGAVARDGTSLAVTLSSDFAYQGGAVMVSASDSMSGTVSVLGRTYALVEDSAGGLVGFVGIGAEDPPGLATLSLTLTRSGGAVETASRTLTVRKTQWTVDYIDLPPGVGDLLDPAIVQEEQDRLNAIYAGMSSRQWQTTWRSPLGLPITGAMVTSYFGEQRSFNGGPVGGHHGGTDLGVAAATPAYTASAGRVVLAEALQVRGNMVIIDHGGGIFSGYAHMESLAVSAGQSVIAGQLVGRVGTTGLSTGPHLHWEMSVAGVLVDGLRWLDGSQGF